MTEQDKFNLFIMTKTFLNSPSPLSFGKTLLSVATLLGCGLLSVSSFAQTTLSGAQAQKQLSYQTPALGAFSGKAKSTLSQPEKNSSSGAVVENNPQVIVQPLPPSQIQTTQATPQSGVNSTDNNSATSAVRPPVVKELFKMIEPKKDSDKEKQVEKIKEAPKEIKETKENTPSAKVSESKPLEKQEESKKTNENASKVVGPDKKEEPQLGSNSMGPLPGVGSSNTSSTNSMNTSKTLPTIPNNPGIIMPPISAPLSLPGQITQALPPPIPPGIGLPSGRALGFPQGSTGGLLQMPGASNGGNMEGNNNVGQNKMLQAQQAAQLANRVAPIYQEERAGAKAVIEKMLSNKGACTTMGRQAQGLWNTYDKKEIYQNKDNFMKIVQQAKIKGCLK